MLNCVIIDDELIARKGIEKYTEKISYLNMVASVRTAAEAKPFLDKTDLMILDIQMPQVTGIDFLKSLPKAPVTILVTAYPEFALEGFELDVMDYIVKPVSFERFLKACDRAKEYIEILQKNNHETDFLFIKANGKIEKIFFNDILFIEAKENYSDVHTSKGRYLTLIGLGNLQSMLDSENFVRLHKSYIVSIRHITQMDSNSIYVGTQQIPISRTMKRELKEKLLKG